MYFIYFSEILWDSCDFYLGFGSSSNAFSGDAFASDAAFAAAFGDSTPTGIKTKYLFKWYDSSIEIMLSLITFTYHALTSNYALHAF